MERLIAAPAQHADGGDQNGALTEVAERPRTENDRNAGTHVATGAPRLASVAARMHTLVLTGDLNHRSAHALEAEIDRACEAGITGITLDLSRLAFIDSIGVAVITFRCGLLSRRGYEVAVIPGSGSIRRAFEQAGAAEVLSLAPERLPRSQSRVVTRGTHRR